MDIYIETADGNFTFDGLTIPNDPANRDYQVMQAKVTAGTATITPYTDSPEELADLQVSAYAADKAHADALQLSAEHNPAAGDGFDDRETTKQNSRRDNRAKGQAKLTDTDDHLSDYVDTVKDAQDLADDGAEVATAAALRVWDPAAATPWPVYVPFVV